MCISCRESSRRRTSHTSPLGNTRIRVVLWILFSCRTHSTITFVGHPFTNHIHVTSVICTSSTTWRRREDIGLLQVSRRRYAGRAIAHDNEEDDDLDMLEDSYHMSKMHKFEFQSMGCSGLSCPKRFLVSYPWQVLSRLAFAFLPSWAANCDSRTKIDNSGSFNRVQNGFTQAVSRSNSIDGLTAHLTHSFNPWQSSETGVHRRQV